MRKLSFLILGLLICVPAYAANAEVRVEAAEQSSSIPRGAQRVPMLTISIEAPCDEEKTVQSMTFRHRGLGSLSDIERLYIMEGARRLTRSHSLSSSDGILTIPLRNLTVPACASRTLRLLASIASDAQTGSEHAFLLTHIDFGEGPEKISTSPKPSPARVAATMEGAVRISMLDVQSPIRYAVNRIVARFRLTGDRDSDQLIRAITFTNKGKARDLDLELLYIETMSGERLTEILPSLEGDRARFLFDPPLLLERNKSLQLRMRSDFFVSRKFTVDFQIEELSDIEAEPARRR